MSQQHYCRSKHSTDHGTKAGPGSCYNGYHSHVEMAEPSLFCQDADAPKEVLLLIKLSRFPEWVFRAVWSTFPTKKAQTNQICVAPPTVSFLLFSHWHRSSPWVTCLFPQLQLSLLLSMDLLQPKWWSRPSPTIPTPIPAPAATLQAHNMPAFSHNKLSLPRLDALFHSMDLTQL